MAKFRYVHTEFWQDAKVLEEMTPEDKYFYLYLLTNPNTTQIGVYQITKKQMAFDLGYSIESVNSLLERFINHHKVVKYNPETRELAILHWGKYNLNKAGKPVLDCIKKELTEVKDLSLLQFVSEHIPNKEVKKAFDDCSNVYFEPSRTYKPTPGEKITANKYVLWRDRQTCFYTGLVLQKQDVQIDHIKAKTNGGSGSPDNLVVSYCKFNNLKSGTKDLKRVVDEWNEQNPGMEVDYQKLCDKISALKEFEKMRFEYEITYRETIENEIYDTYTLRKYIDTTRGEKEKEKEKEKEEEKEKQHTMSAHDFYQQNFGVLNSFIGESISKWVNDLNVEMVIEAMKRALAQQKKWNYAEGILKNWANQNIRSLEAVQALDKEFERRGHKPKQRSLFEQGEESRKRQAEAEASIEQLTLEELEELPF